MRVFRRKVDLQSFQAPVTEPVFWQHAGNRLVNNFPGLFFEHQLKADRFQTTGVHGVGIVNFIVHLLPGDPELIRIEHNHIIAAINMGRILGFILAR